MAIVSLDDPQFHTLCRTLAEAAGELDASGQWPAQQLRLLGENGVFAWFAPRHVGGQEWSETDLLKAYVALAKSCLTTAFILTQRQGAMGRIIASENQSLCAALLPDLLAGRTFATVGISHLTTSRRHLAKPILQAEPTATGFTLNGFSPWVTGSAHADYVVVGATLPEGQQILAVIEMTLPGVQAAKAAQLVALSSSHTGAVRFDNAEVDGRWIVAGPTPEVMKQAAGARTGGLQTSALALGLSVAGIEHLEREASKRAELSSPASALRQEYDQLLSDLLSLATGCRHLKADDVRSRANSLVLRATQAALAAAKGAGFVAGHPAGRWCREALFFLVWSCPQSVLAANLCELAGLE